MSGIDKMTAKIKKKMTLDDLPTLEKSSVLVETELHTNSESAHERNINGNLESQKASSPYNYASKSLENQKAGYPIKQIAENIQNQPLSVQKLDGWMGVNPENQQPTIQTTQETGASPLKKANSYKMTFQLSEKIYKAFNDLYAKRMLEGRKTEKSELICEAIECLLTLESRR